MNTKRTLPGRLTVLVGAPLLATVLLSGADAARVNLTLENFFLPGTQPEQLQDEMFPSDNCAFCHGFYDPDGGTAPLDRWSHSMMGQSARDPVFYACLTIANQDVAESGDLCIRCHAPIAWLEGRSQPADASGFIDKDFDGVACHVCHRMVDPVADPSNPTPDPDILANLTTDIPTEPHSATYIIDPQDLRRASFDVDIPWHTTAQSPFHREALLCSTCHDVSNPAYVRQPDGTYALNTVDQPHPSSNDKTQMFPLERTYSEWSQSAYADGPVELGGRFGGNITAVSTCQDCHMPKTTGTACAPGLGGTERTNLPIHNFNASNTWVLRAVRDLYPDIETELTQQGVDDAIDRNLAMLAAASDLEVTVTPSNRLNVRITNQAGHKLPTGYPEGRRMWINVRFMDDAQNTVLEHGAYDFATAVLDTGSTKVYEAKLGMTADVAGAAGLPAGESFHFALNNTWIKDNRIPPRGFNNADFEAVQAAPVGYHYADGQHWDDTLFEIPAGATSAKVNVYYQTTSKEYIEFLRDENVTDDRGQVAYDEWVAHGKSAPAVMDTANVDLTIPPCPNDPTGSACSSDIAPAPGGDCIVNNQDLGVLLAAYLAAEGDASYNRAADLSPPGAPDGVVNNQDLGELLADYLNNCN